MNYASAECEVDPVAADRSDGPVSQANTSLSETNTLHKMLDDLEMRLFGPAPRGVAVGDAANSVAPSLSHTLKATRQRLESATSRLGSILGRI